MIKAHLNYKECKSDWLIRDMFVLPVLLRGMAGTLREINQALLFLSISVCVCVSVCLCVLQHGTPPLLIAAGCGNIQIIDVLMRKGAEIQVLDKVCPYSPLLSLWNILPLFLSVFILVVLTLLWKKRNNHFYFFSVWLTNTTLWDHLINSYVYFYGLYNTRDKCNNIKLHWINPILFNKKIIIP